MMTTYMMKVWKVESNVCESSNLIGGRVVRYITLHYITLHSNLIGGRVERQRKSACCYISKLFHICLLILSYLFVKHFIFVCETFHICWKNLIGGRVERQRKSACCYKSNMFHICLLNMSYVFVKHFIFVCENFHICLLSISYLFVEHFIFVYKIWLERGLSVKGTLLAVTSQSCFIFVC